MICARCDKPIKGKPKKIMTDSPTVASEVVVCPDYCEAAPRQRYPVERK